jgi:hypothetical protein
MLGLDIFFSHQNFSPGSQDYDDLSDGEREKKKEGSTDVSDQIRSIVEHCIGNHLNSSRSVIEENVVASLIGS